MSAKHSIALNCILHGCGSWYLSNSLFASIPFNSVLQLGFTTHLLAQYCSLFYQLSFCNSLVHITAIPNFCYPLFLLSLVSLKSFWAHLPLYYCWSATWLVVMTYNKNCRIAAPPTGAGHQGRRHGGGYKGCHCKHDSAITWYWLPHHRITAAYHHQCVRIRGWVLQSSSCSVVGTVLLYIIVLYCAVLCCTVLYCTGFYHIILYFIAWHGIAWHGIGLHCISGQLEVM